MELSLPEVPTAPSPAPSSVNGFSAPESSSPPTPGFSPSVARVPTAPTLPDDPTHFTAFVAQAATALYGVDGLGFDGAPERSAPTPSPSIHAPSETSSNPFALEPSFSSVFSGNSPIEFSIPFVDAREPEAQRRAPETTYAAPSHELNPIVDLELQSTDGFNAHAVRDEFPILNERVHGKRLVWLDNAATTQKPQSVIDRLSYFYEHENSNIHRAAHALAARATDAYEGARESVRRFLNARSTREVVFVRGATEGINLIAQSWGRQNIQAGDEILISWLEHHANIVPWQMLAKEKGARLRVAPVDDTGQIILSEYQRLLSPKTRLVSFTQVSNALGTVTPAKLMIDMAHAVGARVLLDGAQAVSHMRVDLQALDSDFFVFSGHKVFAPTGIGAVVARESILEEMPPWQGGGNMIQDVTFERTTFHGPPMRFEAGTGNIADAVGMGAALDWLTRTGIDHVSAHEHALLEYGTQRLLEVPGLRMIGTAHEKAGVLSFVIAGHTTADISTYLDKQGVAVRGGHHCAQPILRRFGQESTVRASLAPYNTREDLDVLVDSLLTLTR